MNGIELIAAERRRQIEEEGWTADHDDEEHEAGDLAAAAINYAAEAVLNITKEQQGAINRMWPWDAKWWKPGDPLESEADVLRCLGKAGALIAAEIDRLQRAAELLAALDAPTPTEPPA